MSIPSHRLILVQWIDSGQPTGWRWIGLDDRYEVPVVSTIGWVVADEPEFLAVAGSMTDANAAGDVQACGVMVIPRVAVTEIIDVPQLPRKVGNV